MPEETTQHCPNCGVTMDVMADGQVVCNQEGCGAHNTPLGKKVHDLEERLQALEAPEGEHASKGSKHKHKE